MVERFTRKITVAGRAIEYWGSQSISSDSSAIFELVKNARDADSTKIWIKFENTENGGEKITVKDNGHGMTKEKIFESWLVAGTAYKLHNTKSNKGRRVLGEMGIGRFSCERLAKRTVMISMPEDVNEKIVMKFDWERYKDPKITFDDVEHEGYLEEKDNREEHGLELVLEDLKSKWDNGKIRDLIKELGSYILPRELKEPDDFEILVSSDNLNMKNKPVESSIIKNAPLRLRAKYAGDRMTIEIYDAANGEWLERDPVDCSEKSCGPFKFDLSFYPLDASGDKKWTDYYRKHLKDFEIKDFLQDHSGIYLYRDQAWMKPYGGKNDWLKLEGRRVQRRSRIGRSQVFGVVSISQDDNPGIKPTAHREVLQDTAEFIDLKSLLTSAIKDLENYRRATKPTPSGPVTEPAVMAGNNTSQIIKLCKSKASLQESDIRRILGYAKATQDHIANYENKHEEQEDERLDIRSHELNVMSIGLITSYVSHEIARPLESTVSVLSDARKMMDDTDFSSTLPDDLVKQGFDWLETLEANSEKLVHFLSFINELSEQALSNSCRFRPDFVDI